MGLLEQWEAAKRAGRGLLNPQTALDFARGGLMSGTTDLLGYPVDVATMALRPFGYDVEKPVGGSDWLAGKLTSPTGSKAEMAGRVAGGLLTPGPEDMLRMTGLLAPKAGPVQKIFAGPKAKTADLAALEQAKKLLAEGADDATVWRETGWWVNTPDGVPRFEIDDSNLRMNRKVLLSPNAQQESQTSISVPMGEAIKHKQFIAAYPDQVAKGGVTFDSGYGAWQAGSDIGIGVGDLDKFAASKNPTLPIDSRQSVPHELQHFVQDIEGMNKGAMYAPNAVGPDEIRKIDAELNSRGRLAEDISAQMRINEELWGSPTLSTRDKAEIAAWRMYSRSGGEVEARASSKRMKMSKGERKQTVPWESYDVPLNELIIHR